MEISGRKLVTLVSIVLILLMGVSMWSSMITYVPCRITMYADPFTEITLGQFEECECTTPFTSYNWDGVVAGEHYQCPVYVKNTGTVGLYITYQPTDLWFFDDQAHFNITCWVIEFGMPCELYPIDPIRLPEKDPSVCNLGFYLPPGKVIKVDIVLYIDSVVVGELYEWEFAFWGSVKVQCEEPLPAKLTIEKFNDINGDGDYDEGIDVMINGWEINVTDPLGDITTYLTPTTVVEITEFGDYIIKEDLPEGWEQTAVAVDGTYYIDPQVTVTVHIKNGETHRVLYGNTMEEIPTPPPPIYITLSISPIRVAIGEPTRFHYMIPQPPDVVPVWVEIKVHNGADEILYSGDNFPSDYEKTIFWTAKLPTGLWTVRVDYYYTYHGSPYRAGAEASFRVTS